ncbi:unnamed protein product [Moneuplotes crassus]|uniref:Importin subunit alpha n=1 Tax=Euplotes crassus TaxID=5936 RepID=A0AAD1UBN9_EUPCR|nr:unnamed protein product [Moneuplotes crassus]
MDDSRGRERQRKMFSLQIEDPRKKIQNFQVNLRKKKRSDLFKKNRKIIIKDDIKMEDEHLFISDAEILKLNSVEKVKVLVDKITNSDSDQEVSQLLEYLPVIIRDRWDEEYISILTGRSFLERLNELLSKACTKRTLTILKLIINLTYHIEVGSMDCFIEEELIITILKSLTLPENSEYFLSEKYKKALILLSNICLDFPVISGFLLENNIIGILETLLAEEIFFKDSGFKGCAVTLFDAMISNSTEIKQTDIETFESLISLSLEDGDWAEDYLINYLIALMRIYERHQYLCTKKGVIDSVLGLLSLKLRSQELTHACIRLLGVISSLDCSKMILYAHDNGLMKIFTKLYPRQSATIKKLIILIIGNICVDKGEDIYKVVQSKKLYEFILTDTCKEDNSLALVALSTIGTCIHDRCDSGMIEHAAEVLDAHSQDPKILEETLGLLHKILSFTKQENIEDNENAIHLQEIAGLDKVEGLLVYENRDVSNKAKAIIDEFYGYDPLE